MVQHAVVVVNAEQQRAHGIARVLVPAKARHDAIRGAHVLDLDHRALARQVGQVERLDDHAIQSRAFELLEPVRGQPTLLRHRRQMERRLRALEQRFEHRAPAALRRRP